MFRSYSQTLDFLYQLRQFGTKMGLENILLLDEALGFPSRRLKFIHIAGTNGKGSVAAMIEGILRAGGHKTGLFTSPHLASFGERIQIDRVPCGRKQIVSVCNRVMEAAQVVEKKTGGRFPTFFEFVTGMALEQFARDEVDFVIWETGMGGRLDATNLVTPEVSVITSVGMDHMAWLGDTPAQIAREKAGIIKPGIPCVVGSLSDEVLSVVEERCAEMESKLLRAEKAPYGGPLGLRGEFQRHNAQIARAAVACLISAGHQISENAICAGLENVSWPGRMTLVRTNPPSIIDGCHNAPSAEALACSLGQEYPGMKWAICFGVLKDKDWPAILSHLLGPADEFLLVPVDSGRAESPSVIHAHLRANCPGIRAREFDSLSSAWQAAENRPLLTCGSLFLAGQALWEAGILKDKDGVELNEKL
ncbi:folylpolyglutamate synthase/dihydrofolate synthase family protein [Oscillatoria amoena NRMC-F 0135]|nr:folylpolyglutamate synthase/dihydrofolate synthase family protein [Oscillatoria amoena NRMC-F 0135]